MPPELGQSSQMGSLTPALQASQNHGAVGESELVLQDDKNTIQIANGHQIYD